LTAHLVQIHCTLTHTPQEVSLIPGGLLLGKKLVSELTLLPLQNPPEKPRSVCHHTSSAGVSVSTNQYCVPEDNTGLARDVIVVRGGMPAVNLEHPGRGPAREAGDHE
jgi:hypothetical protein